MKLLLHTVNTVMVTESFPIARQVDIVIMYKNDDL